MCQSTYDVRATIFLFTKKKQNGNPYQMYTHVVKIETIIMLENLPYILIH